MNGKCLNGNGVQWTTVIDYYTVDYCIKGDELVSIFVHYYELMKQYDFVHYVPAPVTDDWFYLPTFCDGILPCQYYDSVHCGNQLGCGWCRLFRYCTDNMINCSW